VLDSTAADEMVGKDNAEISSTGRCAATTATRTVTVKVMTINLRNNSDDWHRRFPLIADEIVRVNPDVIGLQEIEIGDHAGEYLNDLIAARGHGRYALYQRRKPGFLAYFTGEGIGIMSRWTMVETDHQDLPYSRTSLYARLRHPSGGYIDMMNTHLENAGDANGEAVRIEQAKETIDLANRNDACWPTFFTGDMNARDTNPSVKSYVTAGFADSYKTFHPADADVIGKTVPIVLRDGAFVQNPISRIDFVFSRSAGSRTIKPLDSTVVFKNHDALGFYPSDHYGVVTTFEVRL
jgi:endonuclease/exonuclease/phosphatase family metal-dependent hydrolase